MKKSLHFRRNLLLLVLLLPSLWATAQTVRYVAPGGSNTSNNCTLPGSPCSTIGYALSVASPGDIIDLAAGTYTEVNTVAKANLTIQGAGAASTTVRASTNSIQPVFSLNANGITFKNLTLSNAGAMNGGIWANGATSGLTVENVHFTKIGTPTGALAGSQGSGIRFMNTFSGLTVRNCVFSSAYVGTTSGSSGIAAAPGAGSLSNLSIQNSQFQNLFIGFWSPVPVNGLTITGNTFGPMDIEDAFSGSSAIYMGDLVGGIQNVKVENNTFNSCTRGFYINSYSNNGQANSVVYNVEISKNTFTNTIWSSPIRILTSSDATVETLRIEENVINQNIKNDFTDGLAMIDLRQATKSASTQEDNISIRRNCINFTGGPYDKSTWGILLRGKTFKVNILENVLSGGNVGGATPNAPGSSGIVVQTNFEAPFGAMPADARIEVANNYINGFENGLIFYDRETNTPGGIPDGATVRVQQNHLSSNTVAIRSGAGAGIAAPSNWFGGNPSALVSGNVTVSSALSSPVDLDPAACKNGFQPSLIGVTGQTIVIGNQDFTPGTLDGTDLGAACDGSVLRSDFTIRNEAPNPGNYFLQRISVTGPNASRYFIPGLSNLPGTLPYSQYGFTLTYVGNNSVCTTCIDTVVIEVREYMSPSSFTTITHKFAIKAVSKPNPVATLTVSDTSGANNDNFLCAPGTPVRLSAGGGSSFLWNTGESDPQIVARPNSSSSYTVTVTENGCSSTASAQIEVGTAISVNSVIRNTCQGGSTGLINLTVSGGTPAYTFLWSNGTTTEDLSNIAGGSYRVAVSDGRGCKVENTFSVVAAPSPTLAVATPEGVCAGAPLSVSLTPSEAMRINYRLGNGEVVSLSTQDNSSRSVSFSFVPENAEFIVVSAVSLTTGCAISEESIRRPIPVIPLPTVVADAINACSDLEFRVPIVQTSSAAFPVLVDWRAQYNGLSGGAGEAFGLVAGSAAVMETLGNTTAQTLTAIYTLSPYTTRGNLRCTGPEYGFEVEVSPIPVLRPVAPLNVCSGSPFSVAFTSENAANPVITWSRPSFENGTQTVEGRGNLEDILFRGAGGSSVFTYTVNIRSGNCPGRPLQVSATVLPQPVLNLTAPADLCTGIVDLTAASITAGSDAGLQFSYFSDRNLSMPVANPQQATAGLYFVAARNQAGCSSSGSLLIESAIRLQVQSPAPVCKDAKVNLTLPAITAGSEGNLSFSYWQDVATSNPLANPASAGAGRYFIRAQSSNPTNGCFAVQAVEVRELVPQLRNSSAAAAVCTGAAFRFEPQSNLEGSVFSWTREVQAGLLNPLATGTSTIQEVLNLSANTLTQVRYRYRLQAPGCGDQGAETGTLQVTVQPLPEFDVQDTAVICQPSVNLNTLVSNSSGAVIRFALDPQGTEPVANALQALVGSYWAIASANTGCSNSLPFIVKSQLVSVPIGFDTTLEVCASSTVSLPAFVATFNLNPLYEVRYFSDAAATQAVTSPGTAGAGLYYVSVRDANSSLNCRALLPLEVKPATASLDSPLAETEHCGGTQYSYLPTSRQSGVTFNWLLVQQGVADTLRGNGNVSALLRNNTDSTQLVSIRILARRNICPQQPASQYLLKVDVLPKPAIAPIASPIQIGSGDTLALDVNLVQNIPAARFDWSAAYGAARGGTGGARSVRFGNAALREQLFNLTDSILRVQYTLTPTLSSKTTCFGDPVPVQVLLDVEGAQGPASIAGVLRTKVGSGIEGADLSLSGQSRLQARTSNGEGRFAFDGLRLLYDYTLRPTLDKDPLNGVTTRDLIAIRRHNIGLKALTNPYDLIAADINNSRSVSVADEIALKRLILGLDLRFPSNTSWRFVDADYAFTNPSPWIFPEIKNYNDLDGKVANSNFVGIKIGDLNGDARAGSTPTTSPRSSFTLQLEAEDQTVQAGERISIPIRVGKEQALEGLQFTLSYLPGALRLIASECDFPDEQSVGLFNADGLISYAQQNTVKTGQTLMTLSFIAQRAGKVSDWIALNDRIAKSEGYSGENTYVLSLRFGSDALQEKRPSVAQNFPNPFTGRTILPFWLPKEERVWLRVYDISGRLVFEKSASLPQGPHQFELDANQLREGRMWYYQIGGTDWVETRQMMRF